MTKKALIVDDSITMQKMVDMTMSGDLGFETTLVGDGSIGLEEAKKIQFDIVITDINMPNMSGIELIEALRELPDYKTTPIIVLTTECGDKIKDNGRKAGATGWIVKPFDPRALKMVVNKYCGNE